MEFKDILDSVKKEIKESNELVVFEDDDTKITEGRYWDGKGEYQDEYNRLWDKLVPGSGSAETSHGELLRIISRIYYDWYNNGFANIDNLDGAIRGLQQLGSELEIDKDTRDFTRNLLNAKSRADADDIEDIIVELFGSEEAFEEELEDITSAIVKKVSEIDKGGE